MEAFTGIASIESKGYISSLSEAKIKKDMELLLKVVCFNLRKGDVVTQWNEAQLTLILYN